ncbi:pentatricopeptide repeat-containing protein, mitochondrial [Cocos nucifera]|uniref:Pentatricopeptide repeat-containing protein, mitochondrial n=1 Tax=Cocos nucifera TaxID=13894 RepID=A0A8K0N369_COCNU|nr:pentatricopeptide repeat-containing protein, mitochondrial [Cocos nucifera]
MVLVNCRSLPLTRIPPLLETGKTKLKGAEEMTNGDIKPSSYGALLRACSKERFLEGGLQVHGHMIKRGLESDQFLQSSLLSLYVKCESLDFARKVFDTGKVRSDLICCNSIITMYYRNGLVEEALSVFLESQSYGMEPDAFTFSVVIRVAGQQREPSLGKQLHSLSIKFGYGEEEFVSNSLIQMYAASENINDSARAFETISKTRSPVAWNSMIAQLVEHGIRGDGFNLYKEMLSTGIEPTPLTFSSLLKSSADIEANSLGKQLHGQLIVRGFSSNLILDTALVDSYAKCGELEYGRQVFERMKQRNVTSWNSIIRGYSQVGYREEAFKLFQVMRRQETLPDKFTFPALLTGVKVGDYFPEEFEAVHAHIFKVGLERDHFIGTSLITVYSAKQKIEYARQVFDEMDSTDGGVWSSIISASVKSGGAEEALQLFLEMMFLGIETSQFIYSSLFLACGELSRLEMGKQVHAHCLKSSDSSDVATKNSLVTMYSNCGCIGEAWKIFNSIAKPNMISFNSIISALGQHGSPKEAAELFKQMKLVGQRPDEITLLNLLSAFNHAGLVHEGLEVFNSMEENEGIKPRYQHYACMVDMMARAGDIEGAMRLIDIMPFEPNTSLWRTVLGACGKHRNIGIGRQVADLLLESDPYESTNYVLVANMYARSGRWIEAEGVRQLMEERGVEKEIAVSWIEINRRVHTFRVEDRSHPLSQEIYEKLHKLIKEIKTAGYSPGISDMKDGRREESLFYHCEKLAFAFGDLSTAPGVSLRIMKNLRVCGDCHRAFKYFSLITERKIILRDTHRFHHFVNGVCSCRDYW